MTFTSSSSSSSCDLFVYMNIIIYSCSLAHFSLFARNCNGSFILNHAIFNISQSEIIQSQTATNNKEYPLPVPWLNNTEHQLEFFAIPGEFSLNKSQSFQNGRVYGMDVTSGAAVAALLFDDLFDSDKKVASSATNQETQQKMQQQNNLESPLRVLDLCCAPG